MWEFMAWGVLLVRTVYHLYVWVERRIRQTQSLIYQTKEQSAMWVGQKSSGFVFGYPTYAHERYRRVSQKRIQCKSYITFINIGWGI